MVNSELQRKGVVLLRSAVPQDVLLPLKRSAEFCFSAVGPGQYGFTPFSYSVRLEALLDFGVGSREELLAPLVVAGLPALEHSWVRKRFAPLNAPRHYHPNTWHQDGGLEVSYGPESVGPMRQLMTCWIPLSACGKDSPGLEFIRPALDSLLHYTELDDVSLRRRFAPEQFWAPELEFGDALLFTAGSLHRTWERPEMHKDRLSVEYRLLL